MVHTLTANQPTTKSSSLLGITLLVSLFLALSLPIEITKQRGAGSWQPRKVRVVESRIVDYGHGETGGKGLQLVVLDLQDNSLSKVVRTRFGFYPNTPTIDHDKYPVGMELVAYRNPNRKDEYVLEQNRSFVLTGFWIASVIIAAGSLLKLVLDRRKRRDLQE